MRFREQIDPTIAADQELADRIRAATRQLRDAAEEAGSDVVATWSPHGNGKGPTALRLTLDAPPAKVEDRFSLEELQDPRELRWRVGRLWGRLHLTRARRLLAEARELAGASEEAQ